MTELGSKKKTTVFIAIFLAIGLSVLLVSLLSPSLGLFWFPSGVKQSQETAQDATNESSLLTSTRLRRGETIYKVLLSAGISSQKANSLVRALKSLFDPRSSKYGDLLKLKRKPDGRLIFEYYPNSLEYYLVQEAKSGEFSAGKEKVPQRRVLIGAKATLRSSVYESMRGTGVDRELINRYADIFSWEIDFFTDPRKGDTIELIWERYVSPDNDVLVEGRIQAARYVNQGKNYVAVFSRDETDHFDYYSLDGKSVRRSFLRSPLNYRRISSYFSWRRFHPILKTYRPHLGIDYAAPLGTPVSAIADGKVTFAGWKGDNGRLIKIKHAQSYSTSYGHLSRIAKGVRRGKEVEQGEIIGYVGSTGLSTGPHLDFRV
ncbi:M23 family metallopeptidase, partial [Candidatus Aerophobetes bacterium]|nr:M23 family metallopeptidase [Candidatus Aerophobetes bacterium]